jgi:Family of unknown function (DUF6502)
MFNTGGASLDLKLAVDDERTVFLEAMEESLRPLMRAAFAYGVSYQDLLEVVRALYIYSVRERFVAQGTPTSDARLGIMAGINRTEVAKLVADREEKEEERVRAAKRFDQLTQLLGKWHDDPRFSTPYGAPLDLSLKPEGSFRTFDELIASSGTELDRETAIAALRATGCVELHANKFLRCTTRSFHPGGKDLSRISRLGRIGAAMHSNFVHNLLRDEDEPSFFERTMVADFPISDVGRNLMLGHLRVDGEDFIDSLDKWVVTKGIDHMDKEGRRYGVTAFFFEETAKAADLYSRPQIEAVLNSAGGGH